MTRGLSFIRLAQQVDIHPPWAMTTSGTLPADKFELGFPKPITYTHRMMTSPDIAASLPDIEYTHVHQYALQRWYTPLPSLHVCLELVDLLSRAEY